MSTTHDIKLEMHGAVAVITLTRPAKRNALSDGLIQIGRASCRERV